MKLDAPRAIHWMHRLAAVFTFFVVGGFALCLLKIQTGGMVAKMLLAVLTLQVTLGVSDVRFSLPLAAAVAHNGAAAILFSMVLLINLRLRDHRN